LGDRIGPSFTNADFVGKISRLGDPDIFASANARSPITSLKANKHI